MELEVGMYVRTKDGIIAKVDYRDDDTIFFDKELYRTYGDSIDFLEKDNLERIVKVSYSIIDILEVGDYVNGDKVIKIFNPMFLSIGELPYIITINGKYEEQEIETIVTHEQMEQMEYKVGIDN